MSDESKPEPRGAAWLCHACFDGGEELTIGGLGTRRCERCDAPGKMRDMHPTRRGFTAEKPRPVKVARKEPEPRGELTRYMQPPGGTPCLQPEGDGATTVFGDPWVYLASEADAALAERDAEIAELQRKRTATEFGMQQARHERELQGLRNGLAELRAAMREKGSSGPKPTYQAGQFITNADGTKWRCTETYGGEGE